MKWIKTIKRVGLYVLVVLALGGLGRIVYISFIESDEHKARRFVQKSELGKAIINPIIQNYTNSERYEDWSCSKLAKDIFLVGYFAVIEKDTEQKTIDSYWIYNRANNSVEPVKKEGSLKDKINEMKESFIHKYQWVKKRLKKLK